MIEGVTFFNARHGTIEGWATGCQRVHIDFGHGRTIETIPDREVAGFGSGPRAGFRVALPDALLDGNLHKVSVTGVDGLGTGTATLDGSPLRIRRRPGQPRITVTRIEPLTGKGGTQITLALQDGPASSPLPELRLMVDGRHLLTTDTGKGTPDPNTGKISLVLPPDARHLVVETANEGRPLGRFVIDATRPDLLAPLVAPFGSPLAIDPEDNRALITAIADLPALVSAAAQAFSTFTDPADIRFDAGWYARTNGLLEDAGTGQADPTITLAHYRSQGAQQGLSPSPLFDEAVARQMHPALTAEVVAGRLPCLFAVELALKPGILGSLTGLDRELALALDLPDDRMRGRADRWVAAQRRRPPGPSPKPATPARPIPPASSNDRTATDIWSAWLARLDTDPATLAGIAADEAAIRSEIATTALPASPQVSIIMPTWNRAFTIGEAIQSVLDQSYPNWELLICDDASEDRTADVVHGFDDPRIRYMGFIKSNGAGARNKGLRFARGEYIAYLDSDNLWHPLFLDLMLRRLLAVPGRAMAYAAYLDTETEGARVRLDRISRPDFRAVQLSSRNFMDLNSIVHHRRLYDWLGGFDGALPRLQDWDLVLRYTAYFEPHFVDRIGVYYRRNIAWGQVTQLFRDSGAQDMVGTKTRARIAGRIDPLAIPQPVHLPRITILTTPATAVLGHALARMTADHAEVDLLEPEDTAASGPLPGGVRRHRIASALWSDPARLAYAAGLDDGRFLLTTGLSHDWLLSLGRVDTGRILRLWSGPTGLALTGPDGPGKEAEGTAAPWFPLGSLPLCLSGNPAAETATAAIGAGEGEAPPVPGHMTPSPQGDILILAGGRSIRTIDAYRTEAAKRGFALILPPRPARDWPWSRITGKTQSNLVIPAGQDLPQELLGVSLIVVPCDYTALPVLGQAVLAHLMGLGIPVAVARDPARASDLPSQWIEARAAYELKSTDAAWVFDKLPKILRDQAGFSRLSERARTVCGIAQHPAAATGKLAHALWWMTTWAERAGMDRA